FVPPNTNDPKAGAKKNAELAVLNYLYGEAKRLRPRLAGAERAKIDAHLDALSVLEKKIAAPVVAQCTKPDQPDGYPNADLMAVPAYMQTILSFTAQVLACGLTRVANVSLDVGQFWPWADLGGLKVHDDVAHGYKPDQPDTGRLLARVGHWFVEQ